MPFKGSFCPCPHLPLVAFLATSQAVSANQGFHEQHGITTLKILQHRLTIAINDDKVREKSSPSVVADSGFMLRTTLHTTAIGDLVLATRRVLSLFSIGSLLEGLVDKQRQVCGCRACDGSWNSQFCSSCFPSSGGALQAVKDNLGRIQRYLVVVRFGLVTDSPKEERQALSFPRVKSHLHSLTCAHVQVHESHACDDTQGESFKLFIYLGNTNINLALLHLNLLVDIARVRYVS